MGESLLFSETCADYRPGLLVVKCMACLKLVVLVRVLIQFRCYFRELDYLRSRVHARGTLAAMARSYVLSSIELFIRAMFRQRIRPRMSGVVAYGHIRNGSISFCGIPQDTTGPALH